MFITTVFHGKAEKKLLIILCYHISATLILTQVKVIQPEGRSILVCEQPGHDPSDPCDRESIESLSTCLLSVCSKNTAELRGKFLSFYKL